MMIGLWFIMNVNTNFLKIKDNIDRTLNKPHPSFSKHTFKDII